MLDFLTISMSFVKKGEVEVVPVFLVQESKDLMIRGGDFYAIWDEGKGRWTTNEFEAISLIDDDIYKYFEAHKSQYDEGTRFKVKYLRDTRSKMVDAWLKFCKNQMPDTSHNLDEKIIFSNTGIKKEDYASKRLPYPLEPCDISGYEKLMSTLYDPVEREKLEWAIGSIVSGDSKDIQKFVVMYGAAGTGKSTVLNIIQDLFDGYYAVFDAKALGSANSAFALEAFKSNPLVAIQHDGDLSRIEDNTRLNSIVSHELMTVNEKFKSTYSSRFKCFLFMGTNRPVRITDAKSGILRRLIDVSPSGRKLSPSAYKSTMNKIKFELGGIAYHCLEVYKSDPGKYDSYIPVSMMGASNDFYNFVEDSMEELNNREGVSLKSAWDLYKTYCEEANVAYPYAKRLFKEELKNYFKDFYDQYWTKEGVNVKNYYCGFDIDKYRCPSDSKEETIEQSWLKFEVQSSKFDECYPLYSAQYASQDESPRYSWDNVTTKLEDLNTKRLHYVRVPEEHIVIDFDIKDSEGKKSFELNAKAAAKWPPTYAELSKSGEGIHLHYIYSGDPSVLSRVYDKDIEIKVFTGKSSLRRKLTKCNNYDISTISSGLPFKEEKKKTVDSNVVKSEKGLRKLIAKNLNKEFHAGTKPSVEFIKKILDEAYESELKYDVSDMRSDIWDFASRSSHHPNYCMDLFWKMHFKSDDVSEQVEYNEDEIIFFDVEVFINLFVVVWKKEGKPCVKMINPSPEEIEALTKYKLVGFNCRRYDNHILWARMMGYSNEKLYSVSNRIVSGFKDAFFGEAYNLSYTDIYDFSSVKQSLKKFEIELKIHHQELGLPWDKPVDPSMWDLVADYCCNDVIATEAVFNARAADFKARKILADLAGMTVNDTTNSLTTRIIFGTDRKPQSKFNYRNLAEPSTKALYPDVCFTGYKFEKGISTYKGVEVGEGGRVFATPGMYGKTKCYDVSGMHPSSIIAEWLFGDYTQNFKDIVDARVAIKHKDYDSAKKMLNGKIAPYLTDDNEAKGLSKALKIAVNSVYGLTAAKFENPFRDPRNIDNIVAKRGALFMVDLQEEVEKRGFTVVHIKTDSIKVADPTPEIEEFIFEFGRKYGYNFEIEHSFEKICLVNDAVYIAKCADDDPESPGKWVATGAQFQVPFIFKTLFSKEPIEFDDLCETRTVKSALYLDLNEDLPSDEHNYKFVGKAGQFCPMLDGVGGGALVREQELKGVIKYNSVTGCKGYKWLESEVVREKGLADSIDISYYRKLTDDAVATINEFGDFETFAN